MQKTKLGMSLGMLSAVVYFTALFGGYIPLFLLVGYILLFEQNDWLKRVCLKALLLTVGFSVLTTIINLVPQILSCLSSFVAIFQGYFSYSTVSSIIDVILSIINIVRVVLFLLLGMKAYKMQDVKISKIDSMID